MVDFLLNDDLTPRCINGDFAVGDATAQNQRLLLLAQKGSWRQHPTVGVGLASFLKDESPDDLLREIRQEFERDGMDVQQLAFEGGKIKVKAPYRR